MSASTLLLMTALASTPLVVTMGDGNISGAEVKPYEYRWQQCALNEGVWTNGSPLTERATVIGDHVLRIAQTSSPQTGVTSEVAHYLDRMSLAPIRSEVRFVGPDGATLAKRNWTFGEDGYQAKISQGGQEVEKSGTLSNSMYNAIILGVPLAAIGDWNRPVTMTGFMTQFDATYALTATQTGKEVIEIGGDEVAVRWIDVHWIHNEIGDVYPAGPDASGGRYWITEQSRTDLPRVLRYKTDTYAIEFLPQFCPQEEE